MNLAIYLPYSSAVVCLCHYYCKSIIFINVFSRSKSTLTQANLIFVSNIWKHIFNEFRFWFKKVVENNEENNGVSWNVKETEYRFQCLANVLKIFLEICHLQVATHVNIQFKHLECFGRLRKRIKFIIWRRQWNYWQRSGKNHLSAQTLHDRTGILITSQILHPSV